MATRSPDAPTRRGPSGARRVREPSRSAVRRYLLDSEELVFAVRRHPAVLVGASSIYLLVLTVAFLLLGFADGSGSIATTGLVVLLTGTAWFGWKVGDWHVERFTVTDRRVLLVSGLLTRRVAIMPLRKVTDLSFERSVLGRLCGYGAFVMESAGQQQALRRVDFLPRPESLYLQMSDLLFGRDGADHDPDEDGAAPPTRDAGPRNRAPLTPGPGPVAGPDIGRGPARSGPRVTSRPPLVPPPPTPVADTATRRVSGVGPPPGVTAPLPRVTGDRPLARRPRGRHDPGTAGPDPS